MLKTTLTVLLLALATSSAASAQGFEAAPQGSYLVTPAGDTIIVVVDSWIISNTAVVGMDNALRQARADTEFFQTNYNARTEQVELLTSASDSLQVALRAEQAWREVAVAEMKKLDTSWVEKILWGVGGFVVGRAGSTVR